MLTCRRGLAHPLPGAAAGGQTRHISIRQAFQSLGFQNLFCRLGGSGSKLNISDPIFEENKSDNLLLKQSYVSVKFTDEFHSKNHEKYLMYTWLFLIGVCATRNRDVYLVIKANQRMKILCSRLAKAKVTGRFTGFEPVMKLYPRENPEPVFKEPRNRFQGIDSASLHSLASRYNILFGS